MHVCLWPDRGYFTPPLTLLIFIRFILRLFTKSLVFIPASEDEIALTPLTSPLIA